MKLLRMCCGVSPYCHWRQQVRIAESWRLMALMYLIYAIQARLAAERAGPLKAVLRGTQQLVEEV